MPTKTTVEVAGDKVVIQSNSILVKEAIWGWADGQWWPDLYGTAVRTAQRCSLTAEWRWTLDPSCMRYLLRRLPAGELKDSLRGPAGQAEDAETEVTPHYVLIQHERWGALKVYSDSEEQARRLYEREVLDQPLEGLRFVDLYLHDERRASYVAADNRVKKTVYWLREERVEIL